MQRQIAQLVLLNGFQTCADVPGCEKLCGCFLNHQWLREKALSLDVVQDLGMDCDELAPQSLFMVKGWNRAVCCLCILYAAWERSDMLQA